MAIPANGFRTPPVRNDNGERSSPSPHHPANGLCKKGFKTSDQVTAQSGGDKSGPPIGLGDEMDSITCNVFLNFFSTPMSDQRENRLAGEGRLACGATGSPKLERGQCIAGVVQRRRDEAVRF